MIFIYSSLFLLNSNKYTYILNMILFVFDTETNGLPKTWKTDKRGWHQHWPEIVQVSWILFNTNENHVISIHDHIVQCDAPLQEEAVKIHGITQKRMDEEGEPLRHILHQFRRDIETADMIIAHNLNFDYHVISASCIHVPISDIMTSDSIRSKQFYCTMKEGKSLCNIRQQHRITGHIRLKFPKLIELHEILFPEHINEQYLHNSLYDVLFTLRCVCKMHFNVDILYINKELNNILQPLLISNITPSCETMTIQDIP